MELFASAESGMEQASFDGGAGRRIRTPDLLITKVCVYVHQIKFVLVSSNTPSVRIASRTIKPCSINGSFAR